VFCCLLPSDAADAVHNADYAVTRCLSVHLPVHHTPVPYSVKTAKHILKIFTLLGDHTIVLLPIQNCTAVLRYTPL